MASPTPEVEKIARECIDSMTMHPETEPLSDLAYLLLTRSIAAALTSYAAARVEMIAKAIEDKAPLEFPEAMGMDWAMTAKYIRTFNATPTAQEEKSDG